jgi:hypothetical protein
MKFVPRKFNIEYLASLRPNKKAGIKIWLAKPKNSIYQKIEEFKISEKPIFKYKEKNENEIFYFGFKKINNLSLKIKMKVTLKNSKSELNNKTASPIENNKLISRYTKSEKFLEQTNEIKGLTKKITERDGLAIDKIIRISKFLKKNFKYTYPVKKRGVKNLNLKKLKGDCGEAGALFVTMCRILKIPAINKTGYVIYYDELNNIYEHGWTSVYLNDAGWINIDPLAENIKKIKNRYIYEQKNYFLTTVGGFNVDLRPAIPKNHKIDYWKKLGLPITKKTVQILQPLVFSSPTKIIFKEQIKLIK